MNSDEVQVKIGHDLQAVQEHRDELKKLMVIPAIETFEGEGNEERQRWIIGKSEEYYLTLDESSGNYGLAFRNIMNSMVYLGDDGSIADAYTTLTSREDTVERGSRRSFKKSRR